MALSQLALNRFVLMVVGSIGGHACFGTLSYNEIRAVTGEPPLSAAHFVVTPGFWFKATQA